MVDVTNTLILHKAKEEAGNIILEDKGEGSTLIDVATVTSAFDKGEMTEAAAILLSANKISQNLFDRIKFAEISVADLLKGPKNADTTHKMEFLTNKISEYAIEISSLMEASSTGSITPTQSAPSTPQITHKDMDNSNLNIENPFNDID